MGIWHKRKILKSEKYCRDPGLNQGPSDLQSDALPSELSRLLAVQQYAVQWYARKYAHVYQNMKTGEKSAVTRD